MIEHTSIPLETVSRVTPLGIRFRDIATGTFVADGLAVRVRPADAPERWLPAFPARGGVFAAAGLPGLGELEFGAGDRAFWDAITPGERRPFAAEVIDRLGRFLPMTIGLDLPQEGFALPACVSPEDHDRAAPLYSAPSRSPVPGMAAVRIELFDETRERPASWARVELTLGGEAATGIADEHGSVLVIAPYPRLVNGASDTLADATWAVQVRAFSSGAMPQHEVPDLCDILDQPERSLFREPGSNGPFVPPEPLRFGRELVLRDHPSGKVFVRSPA